LLLPSAGVLVNVSQDNDPLFLISISGVFLHYLLIFSATLILITALLGFGARKAFHCTCALVLAGVGRHCK
jgi:hypothetical protein